MDCRTLCLEAFAIVASYLIISMPIAGATTIRTYSGGMEIGNSISFSTDSLVKRQVSVESGSLRLQVSNGSLSSAIVGVWLYTCGDDEPKQCTGSTPLEYSGNVDEGFAWGDVSSGSPETANLMYFVNVVKEGKSSWLGFWTSVEKTSSTTYTITENEVPEVRIHAQSVDIITTIRAFISEYGMIPANPAWVSSVVLYTATGLHEIGISGEDSFGSGVSSRVLSGSEISSVSSDYTFVFPVLGDVNMPLTLHDNPSYYCGNDLCEDGSSGPNLGETSGNCCLDCPCISGYYCDPLGCRSKSAIGLSLFGSVNPVVSNCYESHTVNIPVKVDNAPSAYSVVDSRCMLGGSSTTCSCSEELGNVFVCGVTVPAQPDCSSGDTVITDNSIRFEISFSDGGSQDTKYIETDFPDITVGSFTCGSYGCEETLGENSESCCYDCGCSSGYCDYVSGEDRSTGECRQDPSSAGLSVSSMEPRHFDDHIGGESSVVNMVLSNKPDSLSVNGMSCEMGCTSRDVEAGTEEECDSSCSLSWSELSSDEPEKYNMSLTLAFTVSGYDPLLEYTLSPSITMDIQYVNGSLGNVQKTLERTLSSISIGPHWCGDRECISESYATCCFDCPCPEGEYCDTQDLAGPSEGDMCKPAVFDIEVDAETLDLSLEDASVSHPVPFTIDIGSYPSGAQVTPTCELAGDSVPCNVYCTPVEGEGGGYSMDCELTIPALDYVSDTIQPFYDPNSRVITLTGNSITVELSYHDGDEMATTTVDVDLGTVEVRVTSHCGEGSGSPFEMCEDWLGEDSESCCRDCGCPEDMFCYMGTDLDGECLSTDTIEMAILGTEPSPWECLIGRTGGECMFVNSHIVHLEVINAPSDLAIVNAEFSVDGGESHPMDCVNVLVEGDLPSRGFWDCTFVPDNIEGVEGTTPATLNVFATLSYGVDAGMQVDDYAASAEFEIERSKSQALQSCEDEIERLETQREKLLNNQEGYNTWGDWFKAIGAAMIATGTGFIIYYYKVCIPTCCNPLDLAACCSGCPMWLYTGLALITVGTTLLTLGFQSGMSGSNLDVQIAGLEIQIEQKKEMCSSDYFERAAAAAASIQPISPVIYGS